MTTPKAKRVHAVYAGLLDQYNGKSGVSEETIIHEVISDAAENDRYENKQQLTSRGLDILDATLHELHEHCVTAMSELAKLRAKHKV